VGKVERYMLLTNVEAKLGDERDFFLWSNAQMLEPICKAVDELPISKRITNKWKMISSLRDNNSVEINWGNAKRLNFLQEKIKKTSEIEDSFLKIKNHSDFFYFDLNKSKEELIRFQVSPNLELMLGKVASFPSELIALVVDVISRIYGEQLLEIKKTVNEYYSFSPYTRDFFIKQKSLELLMAMSSSFRQNSVLCVVVGKHKGKKYLLGSIGVLPGIGFQKVSSTIGQPGSSLHNNVALSGELTAQGKELLDTYTEGETAEITRLFVVPQEWLPQNTFDLSKVSKALMGGIHWGIAEFLPEVELGIYNSRVELYRVASKRLGFPITEVITSPQATQKILDSIHGLYFRRISPADLKLMVQAVLIEQTYPIGMSLLRTISKS
jgi:hypothetical protein